ncbi:MAG: glycyl-radical enzyme activating protein [Dehalococcoidia bacterium]
MAEQLTGRIFNIQRYSLHDGAGIRTLVFFKGCPLTCLWCSNPESQKPGPEVGFIMARCVGLAECGAPCVSACPVEAIRLNDDGKPVIDRERCDACGQCAAVCPQEAMKVVGQEMSVEEVMAEVEKDRPFYRRSGGGLTLGGGEPLAQPRFALALLEAAESEYIHTAIETTGYARWEQFEAVLQHTDLLQMDLKHMDPEKHRELTGQSNELILENLSKVLSVKEPEDVVIRIPVVPGSNDSDENIEESSRFVAGLGFTRIELIPYHKMGSSKYPQYGRVYPLDGLEPPSTEEMQHLKGVVESFGLQEMTEEV